MSTFARFAPRLQQAIAARLGWSSLRPVQEEAGAALLDGDNAVILAPTAGGKTEASMFPVLSTLITEEPRGVGALYIAPIKALLNNQAERLGLYTEMVGLRRTVWHGDVGAHARKRFLADPTELLMTTPESLEVMLVSQRVDAEALFADLRFVVIDEVHALAGTDRGAHLLSVIERIARLSRHDVQRVGLSATVGNPAEILRWLRGTSKRPGRVVDPPKQPGRRQLLVVHRPDLAEIASDAGRLARGAKSLFFCQSRAMTEAVAEEMRRHGTAIFVHHSAVSKEERQLAEERFHSGSDVCIVATSTLELGIDVGDLDRVLQAEAPDTVSSFLQRMGRTGRREGQAANTTFLCTNADSVLQAVALIELAKRGWVESVEVSDRCWPVLVHQLLALSLAHDGVPVEQAWTQLSSVSDLSGIHRAEFDRLIAWMLRDRSLIDVGGRLVLGPRAEKRFGRRNFMELFAVFSSPQAYAVETTAAAPLGTLNQSFVDGLAEGVSCFLLGGRAWAVVRVSHTDRRVVVEAAPRGKQPTWGGYLPQFLGFEVCQAALAALTAPAETVYPYLHPTAAAVLQERREAFQGVLEPGRGGVEFDEGELRWWTFAGGRINGTLRHALAAVGGDWKIVADNYLIKLRGDGLDRASFEAALDRLCEPDFWEDDALWTEIAAALPAYRLSKFQPLMPPWVEREMVASFLLDVGGASAWLTGRASGGRLPRGLSGARAEDFDLPPQADAQVPAEPSVRGQLPVRMVTTPAELSAACVELVDHDRLGLDVETTLHTRTLCLVQLATPREVFLIDALVIADLAPLASVLGDATIEKVIHNAAFERGVLQRVGLPLENVFDTLAHARTRDPAAQGGHSLAAVARRELGIELDKSEQTGDWTRRPLTPRQVAYAALDAEIVLALAERWRSR